MSKEIATREFAYKKERRDERVVEALDAVSSFITLLCAHSREAMHTDEGSGLIRFELFALSALTYVKMEWQRLQGKKADAPGTIREDHARYDWAYDWQKVLEALEAEETLPVYSNIPPTKAKAK